jgi:hypothetical protein
MMSERLGQLVPMVRDVGARSDIYTRAPGMTANTFAMERAALRLGMER